MRGSGSGQMAGQRAQVAGGRHAASEPADFGGHDRPAAQPRIAAKEIVDDLDALFRFQRAGAVDQQPAGLGQLDRAGEQTALHGRELFDVGLAA